MHSDWVIPGALEMTPNGKPDPRWFALPLSQVRVEDTWYINGMVGTGSNDVVIDNVYVPPERSVSMLEMSNGTGPGSRLHAGPLYHTPMLPILTLAATMPALGQARVAVRRYREQIAERIRMGARVKQAEKASAQMRLARVEVEAREAELLVRDAIADVCIRRDTATMVDRARWATQFAVAVDRCKHVVQSVSEASGAHAQFLAHPLQRTLRDLSTISSHMVFDLDARLEAYGRLMMGLDAGGALL
jgi:alkylation response protein AidB-like acyl-CoA dehydrogenase